MERFMASLHALKIKYANAVFAIAMKRVKNVRRHYVKNAKATCEVSKGKGVFPTQLWRIIC